ncbi:uncharacterized protein AB675_7076 [Cyphellophora attinorum]|uniref:Uncharacterized protein n=1 Tax=Cyphellophora attinorum TaxID=1664694 RepID=A0A0N0NQD3_9EURO|nr:uncharacterized protein AB675_7076 [Phialophora attinorum]KPI43569.1 hypothetical protein AB675_7076 [Phialophora attinorum]
MEDTPSTTTAATVREGPLSLLDLPAEIRRQIYRAVLPARIVVPVNWTVVDDGRACSFCHQIYRDHGDQFDQLQIAVRTGSDPSPFFSYYYNSFHCDPTQFDRLSGESHLPESAKSLWLSCKTIHEEIKYERTTIVWLHAQKWSAMADFGLQLLDTDPNSWMLTVRHMKISALLPGWVYGDLKDFWTIATDDLYSEMRWLPLLMSVFKRLEVFELENCPTPRHSPPQTPYSPELLMVLKAMLSESHQLTRVAWRAARNHADTGRPRLAPPDYADIDVLLFAKSQSPRSGHVELDVDEGLQSCYDRAFNAGAACTDAAADLDDAHTNPRYVLGMWCGF